MPLAGIGVDMVEIARMEKVLGRRPNFAKRVFTDEERAYCDRMARPAKHYAARFAAREAVLKALGTGFSGGIGFSDVSVTRGEGDGPRPFLPAAPVRWPTSSACSRLPSRSPTPMTWPLRTPLP